MFTENMKNTEKYKENKSFIISIVGDARLVHLGGFAAFSCLSYVMVYKIDMVLSN